MTITEKDPTWSYGAFSVTVKTLWTPNLASWLKKVLGGGWGWPPNTDCNERGCSGARKLLKLTNGDEEEEADCWVGKLTGRLEDWPPKKVNGSCCGLEGGIRVCVWPRLVCAAKNVFWKFARGGWGGGGLGRVGLERKTEGGSWGRASSAGRNTDTWGGGWAGRRGGDGMNLSSSPPAAKGGGRVGAGGP